MQHTHNKTKPLPDFYTGNEVLKDDFIPDHELWAMMDYITLLREELNRTKNMPKQRELMFTKRGLQ